ncbi:hypothetical protein bcgnr5371_21950 [Bacillus cereus]
MPMLSNENGNNMPNLPIYIPKPIKTPHKLIPIGIAKLRIRSDSPNCKALIDIEAYHPRIVHSIVSKGNNPGKENKVPISQ